MTHLFQCVNWKLYSRKPHWRKFYCIYNGWTEITMKMHKRTVIIINTYRAHYHSLNITVYTQDMVHQSFWGNLDKKKVHRVQSRAWIRLLPHLTQVCVSSCHIQTRAARAACTLTQLMPYADSCSVQAPPLWLSQSKQADISAGLAKEPMVRRA